MAEEPLRARQVGGPDVNETAVRRPEPEVRRQARQEAREALPDQATITLPKPYNLAEDRVRWGPVWAGLSCVLTSLVLFGLLGVTLGAILAPPGFGAGDPLPTRAGTTAAIYGAITGLIAFFAGGYVAGGTAATFNRAWGALNGLLVFLVAVPVTLWLATAGLGSLFGVLGNYAAALNINPSQIQGAAQAVNPPNVTPAEAAAAARSAAGWALGALLLAAAAAAAGGALGTRRTVTVDLETAGRVELKNTDRGHA